MTLASILLTCHLIAVLAMLASLGADWVGVLGLRRAAPSDLARARMPVKALEISGTFGGWARLAVLAAGLSLAIDAWSWQGWIIVGLAGWTALVLLGSPFTGNDLRTMSDEARAAGDSIPPGLLARIGALWTSAVTRTGLIAGAVVARVTRVNVLAAAQP